MHDEACTHYDDMMNNMMIGQEWIENVFGVRPRIGWSIDPFGHSSANPRLLADMGMDAWFFARLDYEDKEQRLKDKTMQFVWKPMYDSLGKDVEIFTSIMQDHYCWPDGFWMDDRYNWNTNVDDPVVSDSTLQSFNADYKAEVMYNYTIDMSAHYRGNHLLVPMGCDFTFMNARENFLSYDNLIDYFNKNYDDVTLLYSTPGMFLDAIKS